jgi:outer membrane lipoprotein-sorting protein
MGARGLSAMKIVYTPLGGDTVGWEVTEDDGQILASGISSNKKQAGVTASSFYRYIDRKRNRRYGS